MARQVPRDRLPSLIEAAIRVFGAKGFRRAQMAEIAEEMGVSPGSLYNYVESKEALFYLVIDQGFGEPRTRMPAFPIRTPPPGAIVRRIVEHFRTEAAQPTIEAAVKRDRAQDPHAELEAVARELYSAIYRTGRASRVIERSALDVPELAELFFKRMRGRIVAQLTQLIVSRTKADQYRRVPHPAVAARLIVETVTWFARNRRGDPNSQDISDEEAEETTVDFIVNSLLATPRGRTRPVKVDGVFQHGREG